MKTIFAFLGLCYCAHAAVDDRTSVVGAGVPAGGYGAGGGGDAHYDMAALAGADTASLRLAEAMSARDAGEITQIQFEALTNPQFTWAKNIIDPHMALFKSMAQDKSVHALDGYVGPKIVELNNIGAALNLGHPDLTPDIIRLQLRETLERHPHIFNHHAEKEASAKKDNIHAVSQDQMDGYVNTVLKSLDTPVLQLYSRSVSLAHRILEDQGDIWPLNRIYNCIAENYLTAGGCYQGRRNRIFVVYTAMLKEYALNVDFAA